MADWIKSAQVGDKVVCVNAAPMRSVFGWDKGEEIFEGRIYTIDAVFTDDDDLVCFDFQEVKRTEKAVSYFGGRRIGYGAYRFRPVQPRNSDISIFTDMLKPVGQPVEELA